MVDDYEMMRIERRSFACQNKLWREILVRSRDSVSASTYIREALVEKMIREEPKKEDHFRSLLVSEKL